MDYDKDAESSLRHPERFASLPPRSGLDRRLLLWRFPSFQPYSAWSIFIEREACWIRRLEYDRTRQPLAIAEPDVYGAEARIDRTRADELLREFESLTLPTRIQQDFGLDGVRYGVALGNPWFGAQFHWWCDPGESWRPLEAAFERAVEALDAVLPASTLRSGVA
ncbi:hypothetical protein [Lysobacter sp. CA199]|uniref:hypothetical protein n=1 Tax=Lysobacter sp. CA199 TaxID=3455608 RepID=UPI003F8D5402